MPEYNLNPLFDALDDIWDAVEAPSTAESDHSAVPGDDLAQIIRQIADADAKGLLGAVTALLGRIGETAFPEPDTEGAGQEYRSAVADGLHRIGAALETAAARAAR